MCVVVVRALTNDGPSGLQATRFDQVRSRGELSGRPVEKGRRAVVAAAAHPSAGDDDHVGAVAAQSAGCVSAPSNGQVSVDPLADPPIERFECGDGGRVLAGVLEAADDQDRF